MYSIEYDVWEAANPVSAAASAVAFERTRKSFARRVSISSKFTACWSIILIVLYLSPQSLDASVRSSREDTLTSV